jgi:hypothetical protein
VQFLSDSPYTIEEHSHRLATWDAATAASASPLCRFTVQAGKEVLEVCGFNAQEMLSPDQLPVPEKLDEEHRRWREKVIVAAKARGIIFTHGVAAKLINSYLKARFVCGGYHEHERVRCLPPPMDAVLLKTLELEDVGGFKLEWRRFHDARWSKFSSAQYEDVVRLVRTVTPAGEPLWMIEQYWKGYQ